MNITKNIFISPSETRLRSGWRILIQSTWLLAFLFCSMLPYPFLLKGIASPNNLLFLMFAEFFAVTLSVFLARRFLDKRSFSSLGLKLDRHTLTDIVVGIGITFFMMGLVYLVELKAGWLTVTGYAKDGDSVQIIVTQTLIALLTFVLIGWSEELLSRGYHLQNLASGLNTAWAVILSSVIFGILHLANYNASWAGAVGIFFAGLFLAFGYLRTRQLWLPMGLHIGWNFFEGTVFGFPVSGLETYSLIQIEVNGPPLWTGGLFGPEAGLVLIPALLLGALMVYLFTEFFR